MLLIGCPLIGIAGRHGDPVYADFRDRVKEASDAVRLRRVEQRCVDVHSKATGFGQLDRRDGAVIDTLPAHRPVMVFAVAVEMDRTSKVGARLE